MEKIKKSGNLKIVYSPAKAEFSKISVFFGYICRSIVIYAAVFGFIYFICDALAEEVSIWFLLLATFIPTVFFCIGAVNRITSAAVFIISLTSIGGYILMQSQPLDFLTKCMIAYYNHVLERLISLGYSPVESFLIDISYSPYTQEFLIKNAIIAISVFYSFIFVCALIKRVYLVPIVILSSITFVSIFIYNISQTNIGFAIILVAICGIIVLKIYDCMYMSEKNGALDVSSDMNTASKSEKKALLRKRINVTSALGGYAGFAAFIIAAAAVAIPSMTKEYYKPIDFINSKMQTARMYVTAYLLGDDIDLNNMSLYGGLADFSPRSLDFEPPQFSGQRMFSVDVSYNTPIYLRSWIGTEYDYESGTWYSAEEKDIIKYRNNFGVGFSPETITLNFYKATLPSAAEINRYDTYKNFIQNGFLIMQVNLTRLGGNPGYLLYMPSFINPEIGILEYNSNEKSTLKNTCYFDGIYTSRLFAQGTSYSTVSYITSMRDNTVGDTMQKNMVYYALSKMYIPQLDAMLAKYPVISARLGEHEYISPIFERFLEGYENQIESWGFNSRNSILRRYILMDESQRSAFRSAMELEKKYREYVYETYTGTTDNSDIKQLAAEIVGIDYTGYPFLLNEVYAADISSVTAYEEAAAGVEDYVKDEVRTDYIRYDIDGDINNINTIHSTVMKVINYLAENMTYSLTPTKPADENLNPLNAFLFETKEGYCVHFATAAAVILREYGVPVRLSEGYVASSFDKNYDTNPVSRYHGSVYDYNAHAWIEVYYPNLGWVQYEATPPYMSDMYEPLTSESTVTAPSVSLPPTTVPNYTSTSEIDEVIEDDNELIRTIIIISVISFVCIGIVVFIIIFIYKIKQRARAALNERNTAIETAKNKSEFQSEENSRILAKKLNDFILAVFEGIGTPPKNGELPSDYAKRLSADYGNLSNHDISDIVMIMEKEEFGYGINSEELYKLADYLCDISNTLYSQLGFFKKLKLRYFKNII